MAMVTWSVVIAHVNGSLPVLIGRTRRRYGIEID